MMTIEVKTFELPEQKPELYFSHTEAYTLISVPAWNWCYLWTISDNDQKDKQQFTEALKGILDDSTAIQITDKVYQFLMTGN